MSIIENLKKNGGAEKIEEILKQAEERIAAEGKHKTVDGKVYRILTFREFINLVQHRSIGENSVTYNQLTSESTSGGGDESVSVYQTKVSLLYKLFVASADKFFKKALVRVSGEYLTNQNEDPIEGAIRFALNSLEYDGLANTVVVMEGMVALITLDSLRVIHTYDATGRLRANFVSYIKSRNVAVKVKNGQAD